MQWEVIHALKSSEPLSHYFVDEMFAHADLTTQRDAIEILSDLGTDKAALKELLNILDYLSQTEGSI